MNARITLPTPGTALPALGGTLGAYVAHADGSMRGLIVAPDLHDQTGIWGEFGQDVPGARGTNGMASTIAMAEAGSQIAQAVRAMAIDGHSDWHIPSQLESMALQAHAPQLFSKKVLYWSSTQYSRRYAWCQDFEYGYSHAGLKDIRRRARAVRSVQLQDLIPSALPEASVAAGDPREFFAAQEGRAA